MSTENIKKNLVLGKKSTNKQTRTKIGIDVKLKKQNDNDENVR